MRDQMKKYFPVSLCYQGLLGGGIRMEQEQMVYQTGKVSVPEIRKIVMRYEDIAALKVQRRLGIPLLSVEMKKGMTYTFLVFGHKRMLHELSLHGLQPNG